MIYIKNTAIVIGFWFLGILIAMLICFQLGLESPLFESVNRDFGISLAFLFIALYFKKNYYLVLTVIMFYFGASQIYNTNYAIQPEAKKEQVQSYIDKTVLELSANLPMDIDTETRLDNVYALPNTLIFSFTMKTFTKEEINQEYLTTKFVNNIKAKNCAAAEYEYLLNNNVSIFYNYADKVGEELISIEINSKECSKHRAEDYTPLN